MNENLYYIFPDVFHAYACNLQLAQLVHPLHLFKNDLILMPFNVQVLNDGSAALEFPPSAEFKIHKASIVDWNDPFSKGGIASLLRNLAGPPSEEDISSWMTVLQQLANLPERDDPSSLEPVLSIPLMNVMPAGAVADMKTWDDLVADGLVNNVVEEEILPE